MAKNFFCVGHFAYKFAKVDVLSSAIEEPGVAIDLCEEESRDAIQECCRCAEIYKLNEELMRERCGGIVEDACERVSLEVMEELIFFSDDEDETAEVSGDALDCSRTKDSDSRNVSSGEPDIGLRVACGPQSPRAG